MRKDGPYNLVPINLEIEKLCKTNRKQAKERSMGDNANNVVPEEPKTLFQYGLPPPDYHTDGHCSFGSRGQPKLRNQDRNNPHGATIPILEIADRRPARPPLQLCRDRQYVQNPQRIRRSHPTLPLPLLSTGSSQDVAQLAPIGLNHHLGGFEHQIHLKIFPI